jgi:hypothetical protein
MERVVRARHPAAYEKPLDEGRIDGNENVR